MASRVRPSRWFVLSVVLAASGCDSIGLPGRATDEWTRSYRLADGGQLQISNTNGIVEIEGSGGSTVDVRAERVARAVSDSAAREQLLHFVIKEDVTPARISIESPRTNGFLN